MLAGVFLGLALAADPQLLDRLYQEAQRAASAGDLEGALQTLSRMSAQKADIPEVENLRAALYSRAGKPLLAEQHFRRALKIAPAYSEARENLALFLLRLGRREDAIAEYQLLLQQEPMSQPIRLTLARLYLQSGSASDALRLLDDTPASQQNGQILNLMGAAQAKLGHLEQAESAFRRSLDVNPKEHDAYYNLGLLLAKRDANQAAVAAFQNGLKVFPDSVNFLTTLGIVYQRSGEASLARKTFEKLTEAHPGHGPAFLYLGSSLLEAGDHSGAQRALLHAENLMPASAPVQYLLGLVLSYGGDLAAAAAHFSRAIELDSKLCFAHYQLAKVKMDSGELATALKESQVASVCDREFAQSHYQTSQIQLRMNHPSEAESEMEEFRRLRSRTADKRYQVFVLP